MAKKASDKVCVGFHSFGTSVTEFGISFAGVSRYEGIKLSSVIHVPSPYVTEARNKIVKRFLTQTNASHLAMLDVDLNFPEDAFDLTLTDMEKCGADIMFGCYALGDFRPSIFTNPPPGEKLPGVFTNLTHSQIYKIYAGSTGWLFATRDAMQRVWDANKDKHWPWFDHDPEYGKSIVDKSELVVPGLDTIRIGEDFTFSKRAREAGIQLWGTTSPLLIHVKYQPLLNHFQEEMAIERGLKTKNIDEDKKEKPNELDQANRKSRTIRLEPSKGDRPGSGGGEGSGGKGQEDGSGKGSGEPPTQTGVIFDAEEVRSAKRQVRKARPKPEGREDKGRKDLQRDPKAGRDTGDGKA